MIQFARQHAMSATVARQENDFAAREFAGINSRPFEMRAGTQRIHRLALTYAETEAGDLFVIVGSSGHLEIAANQASAAGLLGCSAGAPVELDLY